MWFFGRKKARREKVDEFRGTKLTGLEDVKDTLLGRDLVITCSGPSFESYDDHLIPPHVLRVAINESIKVFDDASRPPEYWVFSDQPIIREYHQFHHETTRLLVMHEATQTFRKYLPNAHAHTVNSMAKIKEYDNPYQFYSRGTVLIGAIEMLRYMGAGRIFVFGCDFFRTDNAYYFDKEKRPRFSAEEQLLEAERIRFDGLPADVNLYATPNLRKMTDKMNKISAAGLWDKLEAYCVASPWSQQNALEKITFEEALSKMQERAGDA
jgi:hypothetical protein